MRQISSLWRTPSDSARACIVDRHAIGDRAPRGTEWDVDVFYRDDAGRVRTASGEIGDVFYSRKEALDWIRRTLGDDVRAMRLPSNATTWTHGWWL